MYVYMYVCMYGIAANAYSLNPKMRGRNQLIGLRYPCKRVFFYIHSSFIQLYLSTYHSLSFPYFMQFLLVN